MRARVAKLSQNDFYRLSRALEIELDREAGGGSGEARRPVRGVILTARCAFLAPADRTALYHAIDERCDIMLARGLLEETANLSAAGRLPSSSTAARAIGYRQALDYLEARVSGQADRVRRNTSTSAASSARRRRTTPRSPQVVPARRYFCYRACRRRRRAGDAAGFGPRRVRRVFV